MEENAQLQLSNKNSLSESATLVAQLDHLKSRSPLNGSSVGSDLIGDAQARVLKLQLENQRLEAEVEQLKRDSLLASADKLLELEKENKRLSIKVRLDSNPTWNDKSKSMIYSGVNESSLLVASVHHSKANLSLSGDAASGGEPEGEIPSAGNTGRIRATTSRGTTPSPDPQHCQNQFPTPDWWASGKWKIG